MTEYTKTASIDNEARNNIQKPSSWLAGNLVESGNEKHMRGNRN